MSSTTDTAAAEPSAISTQMLMVVDGPKVSNVEYTRTASEYGGVCSKVRVPQGTDAYHHGPDLQATRGRWRVLSGRPATHPA